MEFSFFIILVYATFIGDIIERKRSEWAALLFRAAMWIASAFSLAVMLNIQLEKEIIKAERYLNVFPFCYIMAIIGCVYLLPVMLGKGKKKKNKITKDAFK